MTENELKEILLKATGYPVSGKVAEAAVVQAKALYEALNPIKAEKPKKETASIEPEETR